MSKWRRFKSTWVSWLCDCSFASYAGWDNIRSRWLLTSSPSGLFNVRIVTKRSSKSHLEYNAKRRIDFSTLHWRRRRLKCVNIGVTLTISSRPETFQPEFLVMHRCWSVIIKLVALLLNAGQLQFMSMQRWLNVQMIMQQTSLARVMNIQPTCGCHTSRQYHNEI